MWYRTSSAPGEGAAGSLIRAVRPGQAGLAGPGASKRGRPAGGGPGGRWRTAADAIFTYAVMEKSSAPRPGSSTVPHVVLSPGRAISPSAWQVPSSGRNLSEFYKRVRKRLRQQAAARHRPGG